MTRSRLFSSNKHTLDFFIYIRFNFGLCFSEKTTFLWFILSLSNYLPPLLSNYDEAYFNQFVSPRRSGKVTFQGPHYCHHRLGKGIWRDVRLCVFVSRAWWMILLRFGRIYVLSGRCVNSIKEKNRATLRNLNCIPCSGGHLSLAFPKAFSWSLQLIKS